MLDEQEYHEGDQTVHSDETKNEIDDGEEDDVTGHDEYNEDHTEITTTYTPLLLMHESP